jgi:hypothetical protein
LWCWQDDSDLFRHLAAKGVVSQQGVWVSFHLAVAAVAYEQPHRKPQNHVTTFFEPSDKVLKAW